MSSVGLSCASEDRGGRCAHRGQEQVVRAVRTFWGDDERVAGVVGLVILARMYSCGRGIGHSGVCWKPVVACVGGDV